MYSGLHVLHIGATIQLIEIYLWHMDTWRYLVPTISLHGVWQHWRVAVVNCDDHCKQVGNLAFYNIICIILYKQINNFVSNQDISG
jgi:hypothetical protein